MEITLVEITYSELLLAATAGIMRHIEDIKKNMKPQYGIENRYAWQANIEGCIGEMVVHKYLGAYWSGKGIFRSRDIGKDEVRFSNTPYLILHEKDPSDAKYYYVTGFGLRYEIYGPYWGHDVKQQQYWKDRYNYNRPAYFYPVRCKE